MNAGLLGEHLASPRTAQKTNQSTALDPKTAKGGDSSGKDDFASHVAKDSDPIHPESPAPDSAVAAGPPPADASPPTDVQTLTLATDLSPEGDSIATETTADTTKLAATKDVDAPIAVSHPTRDAELASVKPDAQNVSAQSVEAGELLAQDARARAQIEARETRAASSIDPARVAPAALEDANIAPGANYPELNADTAEASRLIDRTSGTDVLRTALPAEAVDAIASDAAETTFRQKVSTDVTALEKLTGGLSREIQTVVSDTIAPVAPTVSSGSNAAPTTGLTPTVPTVPLASPGDLTSVILNAINNGIDPQEQLVVQLDPPELGRVMIDFKFDAQGLQQIIVTSENPEALKRLREMHFELTQALREHGLSDQNMTFRQETGGQSEDNWSSNEPSRQDAQLYAAEERRASPSASPTESRTQARDRLDLLL